MDEPTNEVCILSSLPFTLSSPTIWQKFSFLKQLDLLAFYCRNYSLHVRVTVRESAREREDQSEQRRRGVTQGERVRAKGGEDGRKEMRSKSTTLSTGC